MPYDQSRRPIPPYTPVWGVEVDARHVEAEAHILEMESAGFVEVSVSYKDLRVSAEHLDDVAGELLEDRDLDNEQRRRLVDIREKIKAVVAEIDDPNGGSPTLDTLVDAAYKLRDVYQGLKDDKNLTEHQRKALANDVGPAINTVIVQVRNVDVDVNADDGPSERSSGSGSGRDRK